MKKIVAIFVILLLVSGSVSFASTNKPLNNLSQGIDDMAYGELEVPDSIDETNTKGTPAYPDCTEKTNSGFGRGVAKFVGGAWRVLTFWYPEDES